MAEQGTPVSGVIEHAKMSQSGKSLGIKVNGNWYSTREFQWQGQVGANISFIARPQYFDGGGSITWANDIVLSDAPGPQSSAPPPQPQAPSPAAQGYAPPANYTGAAQTSPAGRDRDASIIAQALTKACTSPGDDVDRVWAVYCAFYFKALDGEKRPTMNTPTPSDNEFDDDIPF
jgi:hypothetical protein